MPNIDPSVIKQVARLSTLGTMLVASTVIGLAVGYGLDSWLGTRPWLTLTFLLFGIAAGFINLFREVSRIDPRD